jgi:hypothetical protein
VTRAMFGKMGTLFFALFASMFLLVSTVCAGGGGLPPVVTNLHIASGVDSDQGIYADFIFDTNQPAASILAASTELPISHVDFNEFAHVDSAVLQLDLTAPKHSVRLWNLNPNTRYFYVLIEEKENHQKTKVEGYFTTVGQQLDPGTNYNPIYCTPQQEVDGSC